MISMAFDTHFIDSATLAFAANTADKGGIPDFLFVSITYRMKQGL